MNSHRAGNFSFPDSGSDAENENIANQFRLHSERMAQNICPNGCGKMNWIDPHNRECPVCGFGGFSTVAYDMEGGNA